MNEGPGSGYRVPAREGGGSYREKGSKFLARARPADDEAAAGVWLAALRADHPKARHICFAWRFGTAGDRFRASDDGEPSGTAGQPILGRIDSAGLTDVVVAIVRYFGGVHLGVPGLIHAYRTAAEEALREAGVVIRIPRDRLTLRCTYDVVPMLESLIKREGAEVEERRYGSEAIFIVSVHRAVAEVFRRRLARLGDSVRIEPPPPAER